MGPISLRLKRLYRVTLRASFGMLPNGRIPPEVRLETGDQTIDVELNIRFPMGDQANATQMVNGHVVPLLAGVVTLMITANVLNATTSGCKPGTQKPRYVDLNISLPMGDQANATQLVNGHVVPLLAGVVTLMLTANVQDAPTSGRKV